MTTDVGQRNDIFTIGHSTHEFGQFVELLKQHHVTAIADVRSIPYSRWQPQFDREELHDTLEANGIVYVFLGKELGARSSDPACYKNGRVQYRELANTARFQAGLKRVADGSERINIALMCAERDPLNCHRTILVTRELVRLGNVVNHIRGDGSVEPHKAAMKRLFAQLRLSEEDLFRTQAELEDHAYAVQEKKIAYVEEKERAHESRGAQQ